MTDEIFDSVKNMLALIPEISVNEQGIPEWYKEILDKRLEEFHKNPNDRAPYEVFGKELFLND